MKASELRDLRAQELAERLVEARQELFNLRFQLATGQLDNTARLRQVRRELARIATVMREQEIAAYYAQEEGTSERSER